MKKCSNCLGVLGEEVRAKIIQRLKKEKATVSEIAADFSLTQPTISHHLKVLKNAGMIKSEKSGRKVYYSIDRKRLCKNCSLLNLPFRT